MPPLIYQNCTSSSIQANRINITSYCNILCKRRGTTTATQCGTVKVSLSYILTRHLFAVKSIEENIFCHPCLKALIWFWSPILDCQVEQNIKLIERSGILHLICQAPVGSSTKTSVEFSRPVSLSYTRRLIGGRTECGMGSSCWSLQASVSRRGETFPWEEPAAAAAGKWSGQAQDTVVQETTDEVYEEWTLQRTHIRFYVYTQEKGRQSTSDERIPACQEIYPAMIS